MPRTETCGKSSRTPTRGRRIPGPSPRAVTSVVAGIAQPVEPGAQAAQQQPQLDERKPQQTERLGAQRALHEAEFAVVAEAFEAGDHLVVRQRWAAGAVPLRQHADRRSVRIENDNWRSSVRRHATPWAGGNPGWTNSSRTGPGVGDQRRRDMKSNDAAAGSRRFARRPGCARRPPTAAAAPLRVTAMPTIHFQDQVLAFAGISTIIRCRGRPSSGRPASSPDQPLPRWLVLLPPCRR